MTPRQAWSGHTALSRGKAWVHRLVDDHAYDEWEKDTDPADLDAEDSKAPQDLMDEMLRHTAGEAPSA